MTAMIRSTPSPRMTPPTLRCAQRARSPERLWRAPGAHAMTHAGRKSAKAPPTAKMPSVVTATTALMQTCTGNERRSNPWGHRHSHAVARANTHLWMRRHGPQQAVEQKAARYKADGHHHCAAQGTQHESVDTQAQALAGALTRSLWAAKRVRTERSARVLQWKARADELRTTRGHRAPSPCVVTGSAAPPAVGPAHVRVGAADDDEHHHERHNRRDPEPPHAAPRRHVQRHQRRRRACQQRRSLHRDSYYSPARTSRRQLPRNGPRRVERLWRRGWRRRRRVIVSVPHGQHGAGCQCVLHCQWRRDGGAVSTTNKRRRRARRGWHELHRRDGTRRMRERNVVLWRWFVAQRQVRVGHADARRNLGRSAVGGCGCRRTQRDGGGVWRDPCVRRRVGGSKALGGRYC
jgi:hypothetical protein